MAHRAVSIMCRAMIHVLAVHLGRPELANERDMAKLRRLLAVAWRGNGLWTRAAHDELEFWLSVEFSKLRSRMAFDAVQGDFAEWVVRPTGDVVGSVRVYAADTSETGTGGGEFIRHGDVWRMLPGTKVYVRLKKNEIGTSSCLREVRGVRRMDLAIIDVDVWRAVVVCDAQASVYVLRRGSGIPELQREAAEAFKHQLALGRLLFYQWARRDGDIVEACDDASRLKDRHAFQTAPAVFWEATRIAEEVYGVAFHVDAMADMHNVMPGDSLCKLPFYSRWRDPHAHGTDALLQDWRRLLSWVNPPFALIPRVISLLKRQRAAAAVVVPLKSKAKWQWDADVHAAGVRRCTFDPKLPRFAMIGRGEGTRYAGMFGVVFFDFRAPADMTSGWASVPTARDLQRRGVERQADFERAGRPPKEAFAPREWGGGGGLREK